MVQKKEVCSCRIVALGIVKAQSRAKYTVKAALVAELVAEVVVAICFSRNTLPIVLRL
jgi:hypothetical protein